MKISKQTFLDSLDEFTQAYLTAALWSSMDNANDQGGEPLDRNYNETNIVWPSLKKAAEDCRRFQEENKALLQLYYEHWDAGFAGHDFWLTSQRHGAGFWDRYPYEMTADTRLEFKLTLDALTEACHSYSENSPDVYRGWIYFN